jgi:very-short-patch-repair endonuclease
MARIPRTPTKLLTVPFTIEQARKAGLERWHLRGKSWRRVGRDTYAAATLPDDPLHILTATLRRLPKGAAFSGLTAAWLHGLDVSPCNPIEVTVPPDVGVSARSGMALRRSALSKDDVVKARGVPVTTLIRTVGEVCARLDLVEAVVIADAALHMRLRAGELDAWAASKNGHRGVHKLRRVLTFADGAAESPMESRLRMVLLLAGLPKPRLQATIHDRWGRFVGRPDLYYERERLGIEYDGGIHRDALAEDNRRQNKLLNAGVRLLRFTATDVFSHPEAIVTQVRVMLEPTPTAGTRM